MWVRSRGGGAAKKEIKGIIHVPDHIRKCVKAQSGWIYAPQPLAYTSAWRRLPCPGNTDHHTRHPPTSPFSNVRFGCTQHDFRAHKFPRNFKTLLLWVCWSSVPICLLFHFLLKVTFKDSIILENVKTEQNKMCPVSNTVLTQTKLNTISIHKLEMHFLNAFQIRAKSWSLDTRLTAQKSIS